MTAATREQRNEQRLSQSQDVARSQRYRVLLSAYACHPQRGSEPGLGWRWLRELSRDHEVWVMFYDGDGQRAALEQACAVLPYRNHIHLCPVGVPAWLRDRAYVIRYEWWQWAAYRAAKALVKDNDFDVIHHITVAAWWNCGFLWRLPIPFVFGPVSGAQQTPLAAYPFLRWQDRVSEFVRSVLFYVSWYTWPRPKKAMRKAALVAVSNPQTEILVRRLRGAKPTVLMCQHGMEPFSGGAPGQGAWPAPLRLLYAGQMIPCKNFGLLLEALRRLPPAIRWHLRVAGDGPLRQYWQARASALGLARNIDFLGNLQHSEMSAQYASADVLVFPSCRDSNATVTLEAVSHGLPVVALRIGGNALVLNGENSVLIDVGRPDQMATDFANALERLYCDPDFRRTLASYARQGASGQHSWPARVAQMTDLYRLVLPVPALSATNRAADPAPIGGVK